MNNNLIWDELFDRHLHGELTDVEKEHVAETITTLNALRDQALSAVVNPSESGIGKMEILENQDLVIFIQELILKEP